MKKHFQNDYWKKAKSQLDTAGMDLIPYGQLNLEIKKIKNIIGRELAIESIKGGSQYVTCDEYLTVGDQQIKQIYLKIDNALDKQIKIYRQKYKSVSNAMVKSLDCLEEIRESNRQGNGMKSDDNFRNMVMFMDDQGAILDQIDDLQKRVETNLVAVTHILKKVDKELSKINRKVYNKYLRACTWEPDASQYVILARCNRIGSLLKAFVLVIELVDLNKEKLFDMLDRDTKSTFVRHLTDLKDSYANAKRRHKQHQVVFLRSSKIFNNVPLEQIGLNKLVGNLRANILEKWLVALGVTVLYPDSVKTVQTESRVEIEDDEGNEKACYNEFSAWLVIIHTMVYLLYYYGNSPTAGDYAAALEFPTVLSGIVQAATPLAAFLSTFHYGAILSKNYRGAYIISFVCMVLGNLLYYLAKTFKSISALVIARILLGYSGGRVITRGFVGTKINPKFRSLWSSYLVAFSSLSITLGPGISSFLEYIPSFKFLGTDFRTYNAFSFVFSIISILYFIFFMIAFEDIPESRPKEEKKKTKVLETDTARSSDKKLTESYLESEFSEKSFKSFTYSAVDDLKDEEGKNRLNDNKGIQIFNNTRIVKQYFPIYFLTLYFTINKMIQEAIITEIPQTTKEFYGYGSQEAGFLVLSFTPLTLSMCLLPGYLSQVKGFSNQKMMIFFSIICFLTLIMKLDYNYNTAVPKWYYITGTVLSLSFNLATEVCMTSLFGQIAPEYIVASYCNAGLLSGLADTFGRALGNTDITLFTSIDGIGALTFWMYAVFLPLYGLFIVIGILSLGSMRVIWRVKVEKFEEAQKGTLEKDNLEGIEDDGEEEKVETGVNGNEQKL